MENLQLSYPSYFLIIIALVALVFTLSLYFKDSRIKENKTWLPYLLSLLRFLSILGILFLLLMPLFKKFITEEQKPTLLFVQDKSGSISASTNSDILSSLESSIDQVKNNLSEKFEIAQIEFAENIKLNPNDTIKSASTNISSPLAYIAETYEDQNLAAVVLVTDGIYNEGKNPLYADMQLSVPIYTVPLGDTTIRTDILIKNVLHNRIVYLNDKFLIEADIQAYNAKGTKNKATLYRESGGKRVKLAAKDFVIDSDNYFKSFQFEMEATQVGNVKYILSVQGLNNEVTKANNSRNIYLEVLDARQKILLIANAPHPDLKALKRTITSNKNYDLEIIQASKDMPFMQKYDLIILHDLPSQKYKMANVLPQLNKLKKPTLFICGGQTATAELNNNQSVLKIKGGNQSLNDITPILADNFEMFTLDDALSQELQKYIPLKVPFGEYTTEATAKVLLYQKIGNVETKYPLLAFSDINNHKQAVLTGEGLWRWQLYEHQEYGNINNSKALIMKTLQYISQKEDKRQFRAYVSKSSFKENESISFDAQLYNQNYEAINTPEATLVIKNGAGEKFDYNFSKSNNYYVIDAGKYPEGNYTFTAKTKYGGKDLIASGKFNVQSIIKEQYDLTARHDLLYDLSKQHGGQVVYPSDINSLQTILSDNNTIKPILYQKAQTTPVLNLQWLLGILIFFLAIEWFFRRFYGGY